MSLTIAGPGLQHRLDDRRAVGVDRDDHVGRGGVQRRPRPGTTRAISSSTGTSGTPVMPDWPPTSIMCAPWATCSSARATRASVVRCSPLSENESGVALTMPMRAGLGEVERAAAHGQGGRGGHGVSVGRPSADALSSRICARRAPNREGNGRPGQVAARGRRRSRERRPSGPSRRGGGSGAGPASRSGSVASGGSSPNVRTSGGRPGAHQGGGVLAPHAGPVERGLQHHQRLGAEVVEVAVAVDAGAEVDLGHAPHADGLGHVDDHADLDPVAPHERQRLEQRAAAAVLARQRLHDRRQVREERGDERAGHQLGGAPAADRRRCGAARRSPSRS